MKRNIAIALREDTGLRNEVIKKSQSLDLEDLFVVEYDDRITVEVVPVNTKAYYRAYCKKQGINECRITGQAITESELDFIIECFILTD